MYSQYAQPYAPRMNPISLPAMSPRSASVIPGSPASFHWTTSQQTAPTPSSRFYEDQQRPRSYSSASRHAPATYNATSTRYDVGERASGGSYGGHTANRPAVVERTRSMTPVPAPAPLKSILKSSRTRSHSMSTNPPEAPASVVPVRVERGSSKLSGKSTVTVYTKAALKEEAIALHWPLMRFDPTKRSSDRPLLYFDAGFDPTQPKNLTKKRPESAESWSPLSTADRNLPVSTHCTLTKMIIQCPQIGPITVRRSNGIRCIDVFVEIYDAYHRRLDEDELPRDMVRYLPHFDKRCEDTGIKGERMRRVDLLRGKRIFDGLARSGADWKLEFYSPSP